MVEDGAGWWRMGEVISSPQVAMMASATSSNETERPSSAASVVSLLPAPGSRLTNRTISCDPPSKTEPCCRNARPSRTWAEPTSLRPPTRTSPPTGAAKQGPGRPRERHGGSKRYSRRKARPVRAASARRAASMAMLTAPGWPPGSKIPSHCNGAVSSVGGERIRFDRGTHADEVAVAEGAVHAAHRRPHLVRSRRDGGEGGALARIWAVPRVGDDVFQRVRCIREQVVAARLRPVLHLADLLADRDQRVAEAVQLFLRLALCGLDHQGARDRERDRRRMEAVVDDALRDVVHLDPG